MPALHNIQANLPHFIVDDILEPEDRDGIGIGTADVKHKCRSKAMINRQSAFFILSLAEHPYDVISIQTGS